MLPKVIQSKNQKHREYNGYAHIVSYHIPPLAIVAHRDGIEPSSGVYPLPRTSFLLAVAFI
jgi:hypothetical protein